MRSIQALIDGFRDFRAGVDQHPTNPYRNLADGQSPRVMMIACCDSRVDPAFITNADLGDILMVRNVANLVPPYRTDSHYQSTASAIEFAVEKLKVRHIVVMGHSRCGGIMSLLGNVSKETSSDHPLGEWMSVMKDVALETLEKYPNDPIEKQACNCSRAALGASLKNLGTYPWVKTAVDNNELALHGWYFNLGDIDLEALDQKTGQFKSLL
ncbi:MAG TPA: carbonic anhydrase [Pseudomonadales bacterium]